MNNWVEFPFTRFAMVYRLIFKTFLLRIKYASRVETQKKKLDSFSKEIDCDPYVSVWRTLYVKRVMTRIPKAYAFYTLQTNLTDHPSVAAGRKRRGQVLDKKRKKKQKHGHHHAEFTLVDSSRLSSRATLSWPGRFARRFPVTPYSNSVCRHPKTFPSHFPLPHVCRSLRAGRHALPPWRVSVEMQNARRPPWRGRRVGDVREFHGFGSSERVSFCFARHSTGCFSPYKTYAAH